MGFHYWIISLPLNKPEYFQSVSHLYNSCNPLHYFFDLVFINANLSSLFPFWVCDISLYELSTWLKQNPQQYCLFSASPLFTSALPCFNLLMVYWACVCFFTIHISAGLVVKDITLPLQFPPPGVQLQASTANPFISSSLSFLSQWITSALLCSQFYSGIFTFFFKCFAL